MAEHSSLTGVGGLVDAAVGVESIFGRRKDGVEFGLLDVSSMSVNRFQCCVGIERKTVWSEADDGACILLVAARKRVIQKEYRKSHGSARIQDDGLLSRRDRQSTSLLFWPGTDQDKKKGGGSTADRL